MHKRILAGFVVMAAMLSVVPLGSPAVATGVGNQGCTPGYWKTHLDSWEEYTPDTKLGDLWNFPSELSAFADWTMLDALNAQGGPSLEGATENLVRAATAAYLNAAHDGVGYPYRRWASPGKLQYRVNTALGSLSRAKILDLATWLDTANNLGCPLN